VPSIVKCIVGNSNGAISVCGGRVDLVIFRAFDGIEDDMMFGSLVTSDTPKAQEAIVDLIDLDLPLELPFTLTLYHDLLLLSLHQLVGTCKLSGDALSQQPQRCSLTPVSSCM
jgi:hypothetical protein